MSSVDFPCCSASVRGSPFVAMCPYAVSVIGTATTFVTVNNTVRKPDKISLVSYLPKNGRSRLPRKYTRPWKKVNLYNETTICQYTAM